MARHRSRSALLAVAGVVLALLAGTLAAVATAPAQHRQGASRLAASRQAGGRQAVSRRATTHRNPREENAALGDLLFEPDLFRAMVTGQEPVDPRDTVGNAIVSGRLLFVGASYSLGLGATGKAHSFPSMLAAQYHEQFRVDAVSASGFQNPGPHHQGTFAQRILRDPISPPPRIVVIQGGRDDYRYPLDREYAAALTTIQLAQRRFEEAQVVVLGPIPGRLPVPSRLLAVNADIQRAALTARAGYIDPIAEHWMTRLNVHEFAGHIPGHPNDAGYAYITERLRQELPAALASSARPLEPDGT